MRVLHWDVSFLDGGGVANAVRGLAMSQARLGAEVAIATAKATGPPMYEPMETGGRVTLLEWEPRWAFQLHGFRLRGLPAEARRRLRAFKPDIVHVHGGFNGDNLWVPSICDGAVVFSPHGSYHREVFRKGRVAAKALYLRLESRFLHRRVSAFHSLSPIEREQITRLIPGRRVYCVPQGPGIQAQLSVPPDELAGDDDGVRFVCVGRLDVFTKGLDILLEAFADAVVRLNGHCVTLTLVGPEWKGGMARLQRRGKELGIASRTVFTGPLSSADVATTLRRSHIYVNLPRHEAFSLSVAEALLAGKPAILSEGVGLASYPQIAELPHIRVVPLSVKRAADTMVDFAQRLGQLRCEAAHYQSRLREFFSWERIGGAHLAIYEQIRAGAL
jgi:glycosyltransferase involved in cell wall biosynthesis